MQFVDFPTDVLLYLLGYLELDDALILLSTCTRLRQLSENRSLWISILQRIQANGSRPLACPIQQEFSQLNLSDLQKIAYRTVRLEKNWSRENPRIIGAVSTTQCEGVDKPLCILTVIPGTDILVVYSNGQLFCYDLPAATSSPPLRIGEMSCYAQFDERGKKSIGVVHKIKHDYRLDIFCVEYGPGTSPILRRVYQKFDTLSCLMQGSYVYISTQTESCTCHLLRCDISAPWDGHTDGRLSPVVTIEPLDPTLRGHPRFQPTQCQLLQRLGLTALYTDIYSNSITTTVLFQPDVFTSFGQTPDILRLGLPGNLHPPHPYNFSTDSGNYLLLCTEPKDDDDSDEEIEEDVDPPPEFYLVHFVKGPPASIAARQLKMPDFVEKELVHNRIDSVIVDDHLGVVYLTHEGGYISAVPFA